MQRTGWGVLALALFGTACGGGSSANVDAGPPDAAPGPYDEVAVDTTVTNPDLTAPVDIVRDEYGVPHIYARSLDDAGFANGYIMAADRLSQMDLFRHFGSGTLAELFGAISPSVIDGDIVIRMHGLRRTAEAAWAELQASNDPDDVALVSYIERYADGVNQYLDELVAGLHTIDPTIATFFDPTRVAPWTPVDSLVIGRLQTYSLDYSSEDINRTLLLQQSEAVFSASAADPNLARRVGAFWDLYPMRPLDPTSTIPGWPDGSTSGKPASGRPASGKSPAAAATVRRPHVPQATLAAAAQTLLRPKLFGQPLLAHPQNGSNNWVVGSSLAGGHTFMANDPHLQLYNPPIWYLIHITVPGSVDVEGVSFPGIPAVILGHTPHVAWGATTAYHDVTDVYAESVHDCPPPGSGYCVTWKGGEVPLTSRIESIGVGVLGTITSTRQVTLYDVPHHGPIVVSINPDHTVAPLAVDSLSVKYTGHEVTQDIRFIFKMNRATTVEEGFAAIDDWDGGSINWVMADDAGHIGWTQKTQIPRRDPACYTYNADTNPMGPAPFFVEPGDGSCEWDGWLDVHYIPHARDPATGFLASANGDPVGETADGDVLNGPMVDGRPLYVGSFYDNGLRPGRITRRLQELAAEGRPLTLDDMGSIQADTHSNYGELLQPALVAAGTAFAEELATPGSHPDLATWVAALPAGRRTQITEAAARLAAWTLATPAATEAGATQTEIDDSIATSLFNTWFGWFTQLALNDETSRIGGWMGIDAAALMLIHPETLRSGLAVETGEPVLCDNIDTTEVESCTLLVLQALDNAYQAQAAAQGADLTAWRWGNVHTVRFSPLTPQDELAIPPGNEPGFPRPGECSTVDVACGGVGRQYYEYDHGPSMRHLVELIPGEAPKTRMQLPGGQIYDPSSPHFRDLADQYWTKNVYFDLPYQAPEIIQHAETHWVLKP